MLDVNQIFLLHYAIELHVALVLFPNISRIHGYIAVTSYSHTDCRRRTASKNRKERARTLRTFCERTLIMKVSDGLNLLSV